MLFDRPKGCTSQKSFRESFRWFKSAHDQTPVPYGLAGTPQLTSTEPWAIYTALESLGRDNICTALATIPWQGPGAVGEETFHPPSLRALTARLQHCPYLCLLLAPRTLIFLLLLLLFIRLLSHSFSGNSLLCWPATVCLRRLSASRQFMGNLNSTDHEAENLVRASMLCSQLSNSKIPGSRFVSFKMLSLGKRDGANVMPLKPCNRPWCHEDPWNSTSPEGQEVDVFIYS